MKKLFVILLVVILSFLISSVAQGGSASLYLSPAAGTFFIDSTFDVSVFINTGGENVNAVQVDLKFDPSKLQVASPTAGKSFIEVWVSQPVYSNTKGTVSFIGGLPSPGINTSAGLVSTVTFRAIAPGQTTITFLETSKVLRNDPEGTNILTSKSRGVYNLVIPPPEGPKVFSPTHPDQNKWYDNNNPTFSWEKEEGVTDFSYTLNQDSSAVPDNISQGDHTSVSFSDVKDGIGYFHLKAKRAEVWGGVSHYTLRIDTTPPAVFLPTVEPSSKTTERQPLISFITTDALSGMAYYQIKYIDITPERKEEDVGFFTEVVSPYKFPSLEVGKYLVIVRAYDVAGNFREGTIEIEILPEGVSLTKKGIQYREIIIYWWILILILIIILSLISFNFFGKFEITTKKRKNKFREIENEFEEQRKKYLTTKEEP